MCSSPNSIRYLFLRTVVPSDYPARRSRPWCRAGHRRMTGVKLKLDLHDIYNRGADIDRALRDIMAEAEAKKAPLVEIIPGKGSGQLKKHVLRFLEQKDVKAKYHRVEKDSKNFGRLFIHFKWKQRTKVPIMDIVGGGCFRWAGGRVIIPFPAGCALARPVGLNSRAVWTLAT